VVNNYPSSVRVTGQRGGVRVQARYSLGGGAVVIAHDQVAIEYVSSVSAAAYSDVFLHIDSRTN
jgi:hypothetical protein